MIRRLLLALPLSLFALPASAICPDHKMTLCEIVRDNEWVLRATGKSTQIIKDEDDPDGVAGWLYTLKVGTDYRGKLLKNLAVLSANTTSRVVLKTGLEYFVFASRNALQLPETGNYCDEFTESGNTTGLEREIQDCIKNEVR